MTTLAARSTDRHSVGARADDGAVSETRTPRFVRHTPETAPAQAAARLTDLWQRHGGPVGPMVRTMAGSPSVLAGYLDLSRAMKRSRLPRHVTERISLAIQQRLGCELCLGAHASAARDAGVTEEEVFAARSGTSTDPKVASLVEYAVRLHAAPRGIDEPLIDGLRAHGWTDRQLLDVVGLVSLNVLTGTFNLIAGIESENTPNTPNTTHPDTNNTPGGGTPSAGPHEGATP